jgi:hypothetical protein
LMIPRRLLRTSARHGRKSVKDDGEDAPSGDLTMTIIQYMIHLPMGKFPWLC